MAQPSQSPSRAISGVSTDYPWGPLANFGTHNPFMYMFWRDDFFLLDSSYVKTTTGNGTIANAAGSGGTLLFTTNSSTPAGSDVASLQLAAAAFALVAGKKAFFLTRIKLSSISNAAFRVGMIPTDTTPLTVTDGIYFDKPTGALTGLTIVSMSGSAATTVTVPTSAYTLANDTYIDLGWYLDRYGAVMAFVGAQLVGWLPQSGTGSSTPSRGAVAAVPNTAALPTGNLNIGLVIGSGAAASSTMTVDFAMAAVER